MLKPIALATLISGTLDILFATLLTLIYGRAPSDMLRFVASGPFPAATEMGASGAVLGLVVHFILMLIMAVVFMGLVRVRPALLGTPYRTALGYGLITYVILDLVIVPLRFPAAFPPKPMSIATQLFAHIVLVGIVFVLVARSTMKKGLQVRPAAA
jgi:hypothetical protein